ncbi:hypothetical protein EC957_007259 [Mortierella hygrophila]|uniref:Dienelactone hydrolase domain-containing protein n=1 Tax=Mortierella hygrophila TaxID=979708 RepID=A0A9P6EY65_9FUNG|nr:hypothetical protein EC957_007259 [Mortierella hygrophila]
MTFVEACCNTPPTNTEWVNKGVDKVLPTKVNGEDRLTYRTGPKDSKRGIIGVYDIFGFHPTTYQFFDRLALANGGFQVSVPHMFKEASPAAQLMGNLPALMEWVGKHGSYKESHIDAIIRSAVEDLRADGCTSFSIIGQCWGTWIAIQAASEEDSVFLAVGGPHPSRTTIEAVKDVKCPLVLVATKDEADMIPVVESVKHKNFAVESFHKRFENMHHGYCGGRGDWTDPEQFKAGLETIEIFADYFAKVVEVSEQQNK